MKLPRSNVYWIDAAGILVLALMTAGLHVGMIRPALDQRTREDDLRARLTAMRSNLTALRSRAREFEGRVEEARRVVDDQPTLEPSEALLTRRAALTTVLADHNLLLDEFEMGPAAPPASDSPTSASARRSAATGAATDPAAPGPAERFTRHALTLRGEGAFPDIVAMTTDLRAQFADMLIEAVEITGQPLASSDQRRFTLQIVWYASRDPGP